jgi:putative transposase
MARLPRLSRPGIAHYVLQRGHNGGAVVLDDLDTERLLQTLREAARSNGVVLHAHAVSGSELRLLATPDSAVGISRMMQALGRQYASGFNRRHGRSGSLWDGRFRAALVESGPAVLTAMRHIDQMSAPVDLQSGELSAELPAGTPPVPDALQGHSSAGHRTGGRRDPALVDPPVYWELGNTPFDRESRYRSLLADPIPPEDAAALMHAVQGCWAWGSAAFLEDLAALTARPAAPRPRGRPRRGT